MCDESSLTGYVLECATSSSTSCKKSSSSDKCHKKKCKKSSSSSSSSSSATYCNKCGKSSSSSMCNDCQESCRPRCGPVACGPVRSQIIKIRALIAPLNNFQVLYDHCRCMVEFEIVRKSRAVTMMWEGFQGSIAVSGIAYVAAVQTFCNLPPQTLEFPIRLIYKGTGTTGYLQIDPHDCNANVKFYMNICGTGTGIMAGDFIVVPGGAVQWITRDC